MDDKRYQEYWQQYEILYRLVGKGRKRYFLLGLMGLVMINLFLILPASMFYNVSAPIAKVTVVGGAVGLLLNLITSLRIRYLRDILIWGVGVFVPAIFQLFIVGFTLILIGSDLFTLILVIGSSLLSIYLAFRDKKHETEKWELARRKGLLREYLDEETWTIDNDLTKASRLGLKIAIAEEKMEQYKNSLKWLRRLEKLHYLVPGIMISLRRAFGHEEVILT